MRELLIHTMNVQSSYSENHQASAEMTFELPTSCHAEHCRFFQTSGVVMSETMIGLTSNC